MRRALAITSMICLLFSVVLAQDKPEKLGLAVYKLGERYATDEQAGETIDSFADYLDKQVAGADFHRVGVRNKPDDVLKLLKDADKPVAVAIISPGLYFKHGKDLKLTAIAEATRGGNNGERYALVGPAEAKEYPSGKKIATSMTADLDWLNKAVLRAPEGAKPVEWVQYDNLLDAGYEIIDEEDDAPDFVLVDRITLEFFEKDSDLNGFKKGLESDLLPQDFVVEVDGRLGKKADGLKKALGALNESDEGKKLGEQLQSPRFPAPDEARIKKVQAWYDSE
ncbi:MAG: hypothetical protein K8I27_04320 [Planctomycetes bacterium]|nr:hypothetical protein [Planctomycetota bacterium]